MAHNGKLSCIAFRVCIPHAHNPLARSQRASQSALLPQGGINRWVVSSVTGLASRRSGPVGGGRGDDSARQRSPGKRQSVGGGKQLAPEITMESMSPHVANVLFTANRTDPDK